MTPRDIYADVVAFIDGHTADVPPDIGLRMVRSYASNLAQPGESLLDRDNEPRSNAASIPIYDYTGDRA